jgi:hypothetical protein
VKNKAKLFNPTTGQVYEPPAKKCRYCGEFMNWRTSGQLQRRKNGRYTYQGNCKGNCQREKVNAKVCPLQQAIISNDIITI